MEGWGLNWGEAPWRWIAFWNEQLRHVAYYAVFATLFTVILQLRNSWRARRPVRIVIVNGDDPKQERVEIAKVPRPLVSRAEVNGLLGQFGGQGLDLRRFRFDHKFKDEIAVELPAESFERVISGFSREAHEAKRAAPAA